MSLFVTLPTREPGTVDRPGRPDTVLRSTVANHVRRLLRDAALDLPYVPHLPYMKKLVAFDPPPIVTFPGTMWSRVPMRTVEEFGVWALHRLTGNSILGDGVAGELDKLFSLPFQCFFSSFFSCYF